MDRRSSLPSRPLSMALAGVAVLVFAVALFARLGHPLLWQDEAETAMFAERVLDFGYPKVHGPTNVVYQFGFDPVMGVKEPWDAYIGTTWAQFYYAALGVGLAGSGDDPHRRTVWLRLPFALAGAVGVVVVLVTSLCALPSSWRPGFAAGYLLMVSGSVGLLLHLREARYYALATLLLAALAGVHALHVIYGRLSTARWSVAQATLLVLLFHTFYLACAAGCVALGVDALCRMRRAPKGRERHRVLARALLPLALAAVPLAASAVFFETLQIGRAFARRFEFTTVDYLHNVAAVLGYLARHDWLVPAVLAGGGAWIVGRIAGSQPGFERARELTVWFAILVVASVAVVAGNPLLYGRYLVPVSPLLIAACLLDSWVLAAARGRAAPAAARRWATVGLALVLLGGLGSLWARWPTLRGRVAELVHPVGGPVDELVAFVQREFDDPEALVIATNYESFPLMFYLGSQVIVGFSGSNLERDRRLEPDLVVPRKWWRPQLDVLGEFLQRGCFRRVVFETEDTPYNSIPEVGRWESVPLSHWFQTRRATGESDALEIYVREGCEAQSDASGATP